MVNIGYSWEQFGREQKIKIKMLLGDYGSCL
jgi:hypothetical protein